MSIIVCKFGGSSMADAECFKRVLKIVRQKKSRRYIILSAPGRRYKGDEKITDLLVRAYAIYVSGKDGKEPLTAVRERFAQIIRSLKLNIRPDAFLGSLEEDVRASPDRAASRGEYLCARLFAEYADMPFVDASEVIRFDQNGRIQRDEIAQAVSEMERRYPCAVIPGFYGSLPDGSIKTFTRGGSDITGALIAAALNADIYENWTDVDGLMSIDPTVCPEAICHPAVSYRQMRLLANAGAQVLHPYCVEPVCEAGIPTVLKNTFAPELPGTYISDAVQAYVPCICARSGCAAVSLDQLSPQAKMIAHGLRAERYSNNLISLCGDQAGAIGCPAVAVSVFCPSERMRGAAKGIRAVYGEMHAERCSKYLVAPEYSRDIQRAFHAMIPGITGASRIHGGFCEPCHPSR